MNRKCDNAFSQADFGDDADKIDENLEQGTVIDTEHGYNDGHIAIKKAIWFIDKDVTSGEQAPIAGYFTMFYSKNTVSFNVSFGTFEVDIINENSLKNS